MTIAARVVASLLPPALAVLWCWPAAAYRPFDVTDASVADLDHIEVELGPVEYVRAIDQRMLLAPDLTLNYGFAPGWEAVLEGQTAHGLSAAMPRISQTSDEFSLKTVLRDGVLQEQPGPSIAAELGMLLPGIEADHGTGARQLLLAVGKDCRRGSFIEVARVNSQTTGQPEGAPGIAVVPGVHNNGGKRVCRNASGR